MVHYVGMPTIFEVTRELTQANLDLTSKEYFDSEEVQAKFIRIGLLVLYAPLIRCDPIPGQKGSKPEHRSIMSGAVRNTNPELRKKTHKAFDAEQVRPTSAHLHLNEPINDAGHLLYIPGEELLIHGESVRYKKAEQAGRELTLETVRLNFDLAVETHHLANT